MEYIFKTISNAFRCHTNHIYICDGSFNSNYSNKTNEENSDSYPFLTVVSVGLYLIAFSPILGKPFDDDCEFRLHENSNLIVKQIENDSPIVGNEKKGYDYKFYVKDTTKPDHLIYLGQTKKKEIFLDDKTNTSQLFTNYYYYVQKHHLNDKFTKELYFEKDPNTTNANGVPQYVLKGTGITLKIRMQKNQKYQIYTVKE